MTKEHAIELLERDCERYQLTCGCGSKEDCDDCYVREAISTLRSFKLTGTKVLNKRSGAHGVVIREWETGQVLVCESTEPYVFCTHDSWDTLEVIE